MEVLLLFIGVHDALQEIYCLGLPKERTINTVTLKQQGPGGAPQVEH